MMLRMRFDHIPPDRIPFVTRAGEIDAGQNHLPRRHPRDDVEQAGNAPRTRRDARSDHEPLGRRVTPAVRRRRE